VVHKPSDDSEDLVSQSSDTVVWSEPERETEEQEKREKINKRVTYTKEAENKVAEKDINETKIKYRNKRKKDKE
jgi:hypothetical protein